MCLEVINNTMKFKKRNMMGVETRLIKWAIYDQSGEEKLSSEDI